MVSSERLFLKATFYQLSTLYIFVYICQSQSPNSSHHHHFPPLVSIRLFSTSVPLFLPCKPVHLYHFSRFHIYAFNIQYLFFSFWLTSLCVTVSMSIHVSTNDPITFLFMAEEYSIVYMYHIFFHSSVNGQMNLCCFHDLAIVNSTSMNTGVHVSFWIMVFSGGIWPVVGLLGHMVILFLVF